MNRRQIALALLGAIPVSSTVAFSKPSHAGPKRLQIHYQLFGPTQYDGSLKYAAPPTWGWSGTAATASTKTFEFGLNSFRTVWARWINVWTPGMSLETKLRLVNFSDFVPGVVNEMVIDPGNGGMSPRVSGAVITDQLNALIDAGSHVQIGWQSIGDSITPFYMYESRLEVVYEIA